MNLGSGSTSRPEAEPEFLGGLEDLDEEFVDVAGARFVQLPAEEEGGDEDGECGGEIEAVLVEFQSRHVGLDRAERIDEEPPQDRGYAKGQVAHDREEGEEMAASHHGRKDHGQACVVHVDQREGATHEQVQAEHDRDAGRQQFSRQDNPTEEDDKPDGQAEGQDGFAPKPVGAGLEPGEAGQAAEKGQACHEHDAAFGQARFGTEIGHGERRDATIRDRPGDMKAEPSSGRQRECSQDSTGNRRFTIAEGPLLNPALPMELGFER
jgi:hypothetical protein